ncbi:chaplin [Actinacidiphila sp. bgisy160]|uniref:chaplin n=1 Tax=Actinacidiphila sp. bgisy160 TaxID=3413796 RepID=UPI003D747045
MNVIRFSKAVATTIAAGALVLGSAAGALADDYGKGYGKGYGKSYDKGYDGYGFSGAYASAIAVGSPGILSGNVIQHPINIPINHCGNGHNHWSLLNPTTGNYCVNR